MTEFEKNLNFYFKAQDLLQWETKIYFPSDFNKIENRIGIYSWHLLPSLYNSDESLSQYLKIYSENEISLLGKSNFSEYGGGLSSESIIDFDKLKLVHGNQKARLALIFSFSVFSPCLYIGISENLQLRISQHYSIITKSIHKESFNDEVESERDSAEQEYLRSFGDRISEFVRQNKLEKSMPTDFFVKILYLDSFESSDRVLLEGIEHLLNRSFKPKFGIR